MGCMSADVQKNHLARLGLYSVVPIDIVFELQCSGYVSEHNSARSHVSQSSVAVGVLAVVVADESLSPELYSSMRATVLMRLGSACHAP